MKNVLPLVLVLALLALSGLLVFRYGCGGAGEGQPSQRSRQDAETAAARILDLASSDLVPLAGEAAPAPSHTPVAEIEPRKVIYTATFALVVGDIRGAQDRIKAQAEQMGGYMERMGGSFIVVRIPAEKFEQVEGMLAKFGSVTGRDISALDVTEQYFDMEVRLKNARALAERLREIAKQAAGTSDLLEAEKELARVTDEIERLEGQLNRLKNRIAYATIQVNLSRERQAPGVQVGGRLPFRWLQELGLDSLLSFGSYD